MKTLLISLSLAASMLIVPSCHSPKAATTQQESQATSTSVEPAAENVSPMRREPAARAYRAHGDYGTNIFVRLSPDGKSVVYRPAINEVDRSMAPTELSDGWLLDRMGISSDAVFTRWSYDEYSKLPATPSDAEIIAAVIPGSHIEEIIEVPLGRNFARMNPQMADEIIRTRFSDCRIIFK